MAFSGLSFANGEILAIVTIISHYFQHTSL